MSVDFETERLILRRFADEDVDAIHKMRSDAEFMRFIHKTESRSQAKNWINMVSRYWETSGFGFWAVVSKETNETIGWSGTWNLAETSEPEIGFAIAKAFWGKGLATEAANFALKYTFEKRHARKVVAVTMPENAASRRVMEKIGMSFESQIYYKSYGLELALYAMTRTDFKTKTLSKIV